MNNKNYFENCATLDELKKAYKTAAKIYHPDAGGTDAEMQKINNEYEARFEVLKKQQNDKAAADATGKTQATTEAPGDFIAIISALLKLDGITVELCGHWLWIGGETMQHKDALKAAGCRWCKSKELWSWHYAEYGATWHKTTYSMARIRIKYGSTMYTVGAPDCLPA